MPQCFLCKSREEDDIRYGEFLARGDICVHIFCLYLTSNLCQNGGENQGLLGFMPDDIVAEVQRISSQRCCYCKKLFANISCCQCKCRRCFHLVCGVKNGCESEFCHTYKSFCDKHYRKVQERPDPDEICSICFDRILETGKQFSSLKAMCVSCCHRWFHKYCLMKYAKASGYFLKCPLCNNRDEFRSQLQLSNIFIPDRDAAWESTPNAYIELNQRPNDCMASICGNLEGRSFRSSDNPLLMCATCGSFAIHKECSGTPLSSTYICAVCKPVMSPVTTSEVVASVVISDSDNNDSLDDALMETFDLSSEHSVSSVDLSISSIEQSISGVEQGVGRNLINDIVLKESSDEESDTCSIYSSKVVKRRPEHDDNKLEQIVKTIDNTNVASEQILAWQKMEASDSSSDDEESFLYKLSNHNKTGILSNPDTESDDPLTSNFNDTPGRRRVQESRTESSNEKASCSSLKLTSLRDMERASCSGLKTSETNLENVIISDDEPSESDSESDDQCVASRTRRRHQFRLTDKNSNKRVSNVNTSSSAVKSQQLFRDTFSNSRSSLNSLDTSCIAKRTRNRGIRKSFFNDTEEYASDNSPASVPASTTGPKRPKRSNMPSESHGASCSTAAAANKPAVAKQRRSKVRATATDNNSGRTSTLQLRSMMDKQQSNEDSIPRQPLRENTAPRKAPHRRYT